MNLKPIKANMTEIELGQITVLFSYQTPVAVLVREEGQNGSSIWHQYKTEKKWSNTTTRHINAWNPLGGAFGLKQQEYFDHLFDEAK